MKVEVSARKTNFHPAVLELGAIRLGTEILVGDVESLGLQFPADWFGKIKMVVQCFAIGIVLGMFAFDWSDAALRFLESAAHVFVWGTLITTLGSGTSYVLKTRRILAKQAQ